MDSDCSDFTSDADSADSAGSAGSAGSADSVRVSIDADPPPATANSASAAVFSVISDSSVVASV